MARQPVQFSENYPDIFCPRRRFNVEKFFDRFAIAQPVRDRSHIIHAIDVWIEHGIGTILGNFLHAAMEIADHAFSTQNLLAVQFENYAQHSMSCRMLRPHIDDELVAIEKSLVGLTEFQVKDTLWLRPSSGQALSGQPWSGRS